MNHDDLMTCMNKLRSQMANTERLLRLQEQHKGNAALDAQVADSQAQFRGLCTALQAVLSGDNKDLERSLASQLLAVRVEQINARRMILPGTRKS
jgi:uncharacterized protein involved in exopolysaccharide biosynthesis